MLKLIITSILLLPYVFIKKTDTPLFKIIQDDKIGFINNEGRFVINPVFLNGNDFSEGLASVRDKGLYGFINEDGEYVIKPEFDFAGSFVNGIAVVYKNGKPFFIDKSGKIILPDAYRSLRFVTNEIAIVRTLTNKEGLINVSTKKLIADTIFSKIEDFADGIFIVTENKPIEKKKEPQVAALNISGKFIVPFGKYQRIKPFINGLALVEIKDRKNKEGNTDGVIDTTGNLLLTRPYKNNSSIDGDFYDGLAKVSLYKYWLPKEEGTLFTTERAYEGFINLKGDIVFNDTNYRYVSDFSNGRTFVKKEHENYIMLDRNFKRVTDLEFEDVIDERFKDGIAIVETESGWGIIDTTGRFIIKPMYEEITKVNVAENYFLFSETDDDNKLYGIADLSNKIIVKPSFHDFDQNGFINGLLKTISNNRLTYINRKGEIVWQAFESKATIKKLNIDYMNRGYFYAYSSIKNSGEDFSGGWATSSNRPDKRVNQLKFEKNIFAIKIDTTGIDTFARQYKGYKLYIYNTTHDTIKFNAQDSRLYMKLQAQNNNGEWKDIEYLPNSWCGNSYHIIELEPDAFWTFTIPDYEGDLTTNVRAELRYIEKQTEKKKK